MSANGSPDPATDPLNTSGTDQQQPLSSTPARDPAATTTLFDPGNISHQMAVFLGLLGGDTYVPEVPMPAPFSQNVTPDQTETQTGADANLEQIRNLTDATLKDAASRAEAAQTVPGMPAQVPTGGDWRVDVLTRIGAPITPQNLDVLAKWQKAEGGGGVAGGPTPSDYNWLNTVRDMPGATSINSVGVKSYASYEDGVTATVGALTNGLYGNIISALKAGNDELAVAEAIANSPWGTGGLVVRMVSGSAGLPGGQYRVR